MQPCPLHCVLSDWTACRLSGFALSAHKHGFSSCCMQEFLFHTHKQVSPHLATAKKHGIKTWAQSKKHGWKVWLASKKHTNTFLSSPQVSVLPSQSTLSTLV